MVSRGFEMFMFLKYRSIAEDTGGPLEFNGSAGNLVQFERNVRV